MYFHDRHLDLSDGWVKYPLHITVGSLTDVNQNYSFNFFPGDNQSTEWIHCSAHKHALPGNKYHIQNIPAFSYRSAPV